MLHKRILLSLFLLFVSLVFVTAGPSKAQKVVTPPTGSDKSQRVGTEKLIVKMNYSSLLPESITVSPDGYHVAYVNQVDNKQTVIVDGKEGKSYEWTGEIVFSPDSKQVAYFAVLDGKFLVVVDNKEIEGKKYDRIGAGSLTFSSDNKRMAYVAQIGEKQFVLADGKEGPYFDGIGEGSLIFSPDSARLAYAVRMNAKNYPCLCF